MFEYMAAGIPIIASDFKFYRELLKGYDTAFFVDPLNPDAIADAVVSLLNNDKKANKMGENAKKAVLERFNWTEEENKLLKIYRGLLR